MNLKTQLESSLSADHQHLLHFVADVAGALGYPIYMVGGSVRDLMLGRGIKDFDLTVEGDASALAESILRKLGGKIMLHSKFKTARWMPTETTFERLEVPVMQMDDIPSFLDFVSARSETYEKPGALPTVKRSNIEGDLRRRDFTINAMAIRLDGYQFGELMDVVDGRSDLERGLIRVLHPKSFIDDPTRMFRAIRYSMRYQFDLEDSTRNALYDNDVRRVLSKLSGERIRNEFDLIFEEERPLLSLVALHDESGLVQIIHPALENGAAKNVSYLRDEPIGLGDFTVPEILTFRQTLGWILYLMHLPEREIDSIGNRLAFPALLTKAAGASSSLLRDLSKFKEWKPSQWTFHLEELPSIAVYAVWLVISAPPLYEFLEKWQNIKPSTTGEDLKQLGLEPSPRYKEILSLLRAAWLDGDVKTGEGEFALRNRLIAE